MPARTTVIVLLAAVAMSACATTSASDPSATPSPAAGTPTATASGDPAQAARFPDVRDATLARDGDRWRLAATLSSPYDTPERYADAFRALGPDRTVLGVRELVHDHAAEQPFTRTLEGLEIPAAVDRVTVEGRDLANGWGGATVTVDVPR